MQRVGQPFHQGCHRQAGQIRRPRGEAGCLEVFHADRLVSRILGMGDVLTLIEKAQSTFDTKEAERLQKKLKKSNFDLDDFKAQLQQLKKMGSLESIMG